MMAGRGKRTALVAGVALLAMALMAVVYRRELWESYLRHRWRQISVVALDNCDPVFRGSGPFGDAVRFLRGNGQERFVLDGLNNCETFGANHGIVLDPERHRVYVREMVGGRLLCLDATGRRLFEVPELGADAVAIDPETGHVWCVIGHDLHRGSTEVLDVDGSRLATYAVHGCDICFSPFDEAFWVVGHEVTKIDREGEIALRMPRRGWARVAVSPDPRDGAVWIAERDHPDVPGSKNRVLRLSASGQVLLEIDLGSQDPFAVACDPATGTAWVVSRRDSILRIDPSGRRLEPLPIPAACVAIGAETGHIWAATQTEALRLESDGSVVARYAFPRLSSQSWIAAR